MFGAHCSFFSLLLRSSVTFIALGLLEFLTGLSGVGDLCGPALGCQRLH